MGVVYRAHDRLTKSEVALKCIALNRNSPDPAKGSIKPATSPFPAALAETLPQPSPTRMNKDFGVEPSASPLRGNIPKAIRLSLAQEFRTLASLRHPYIISVLDYGFDVGRLPFFTMELVHAGQMLLPAATALPQETQIQLLLQILQALAYLHQRRVLHRDLKPANILITREGASLQVKVLDFGLAVLKHPIPGGLQEIAGTLGYIAPEVLLGQPASEASDLYAVGVIAYEMLTGKSLFVGSSDSAALDCTLRDASPVIDAPGLSVAIRSVLTRLLAHAPMERFDSARMAAQVLAEASGTSFPHESATIRDSFLLAAEFVGREDLLGQLRQALTDAEQKHGSLWLIGGESGVGKSRLLDELRSHALVVGARVLRGQALSAGSSGLGLFQEALRTLSLEVHLSSMDASVIKSLVPDLPQLLEQDIPDAPALDSQAARLRLLDVLRAVLLRGDQTTVLLLEDLHWMDPDSQELLRLLNGQVAERPFLIIGTYRTEERPELPATLPGAQALLLPRLMRQAIEQLSMSMLGEAKQPAALLDLLQRETEGNALFVVEVVRALAETAGSLDKVGGMDLPSRVFAGGVRAMLQRRLQHVPSAAQRLLRLAAVAGRQLDLELLRRFETDLDTWLRACSDVAVLEVSEQTWRFSHDKLRERLLEDLAPHEQQQLHREIAAALVHLYATDLAPHVAAIGYHYEEGGVLDQASHYLLRAGELAVQRGALAEGATMLERVRVLQQKLKSAPAQRWQTQRLYVNALFGLSRMEECAVAFAEAVAWAAHPMPATPLRFAAAFLQETSEQALHRLRPAPPRIREADDRSRLLEELVATYSLGVELNAYRTKSLETAYCALRSLNLADRHGSPSLRVGGYALTSYMLMLLRLTGLSRYYFRLAVSLRGPLLDKSAELFLLRGGCILYQHLGELQASGVTADQGFEAGRQLGDVYSILHCRAVATWAHLFLGEYDRALEGANQLLQLAQEAQHVYWHAFALGMRGATALRRGQLAAAQEALDAGCAMAKKAGALMISTYVEGAAALCALRRGDDARVNKTLPGLLALLESTQLTAHNGLDGYTATVEICLALWRKAATAGERNLIGSQLRRAQRILHRYAQIFPIGEPGEHLLMGQAQWLQGARAEAQRSFASARAAADQLGMQHEATLARAWLAATTVGATWRSELGGARERLRQLGAAWDADLVDRWIQGAPLS